MHQELEADQIFAFRMLQYLRMGFNDAQAEKLAGDDDTDWHRVEDVLEMCRAAGCPFPIRVAYRIFL